MAAAVNGDDVPQHGPVPRAAARAPHIVDELAAAAGAALNSSLARTLAAAAATPVLRRPARWPTEPRERDHASVADVLGLAPCHAQTAAVVLTFFRLRATCPRATGSRPSSAVTALCFTGAFAFATLS